MPNVKPTVEEIFESSALQIAERGGTDEEMAFHAMNELKRHGYEVSAVVSEQVIEAVHDPEVFE